MPGCGPRSRGVRGSLADRRAEAKKKFICVTTRGRNFGVFNGLGHKFGLLTAHLLCLGVLGSDMGILGDVWPAAAPPASDGPAAGTPAPGSSAGSSTVACTCARTPCAGRFRGAVGALWPNDVSFSYPGRCPREVLAPKGKLGESALTFSPSVIKIRMRRLLASLPLSREQDKELNRL